ncbi:MAG: hypothetical protein WCK77_20430, partial [Verrucomicrobiota bacterium]
MKTICTHTYPAAPTCSRSSIVDFIRRYNRWRRGDESLTMESPKAIGDALDAVCDIVERLDCERDSLKEVISSMQNEILTLREASVSYLSLDPQNAEASRARTTSTTEPTP